GTWTTVGTANIDRLSLIGNYEVNLEIHDRGQAAQMERIFERDLTNARELTLDEWEERGVFSRMAEWILEPLHPLLCRAARRPERTSGTRLDRVLIGSIDSGFGLCTCKCQCPARVDPRDGGPRWTLTSTATYSRREGPTVSVSIKPLEDRIVIKALEAEQTTASGLVIPDTAKEKPQEGEVLAVGPGRWNEDGDERIPLDISVGDRV